MSGVEALEQTTNDIPADIGAAQTGQIDSELDAIWDRANVTNGADRGEGGRFASTNGEQAPAASEPEQTSLEGETAGEEQQTGSTPVTAVPLPADHLLSNMEAEWAQLPPEVQQKLTQRSNEIHARLSEQGRVVARFKPLQDAATEFAEYFNGNLTGPDGQAIQPADGIRYLANIQRSMDANPFETLLSIADTYNLRGQLAKAFGGQVQETPADQRILLDEIAGLKRTIAGLQSPANIEEVLEKRDVKTELSRFAQSKPHYAQVEADLPFYITKAKTQLGEGASRSAVLDKAYDLAVQADPALRAQTQAAVAATNGNVAKTEAVRRATGVNVTSTSSGKAKAPSLDDALGAIWENNQRKN